jgi:hypothetical protein
MVGDAFPSLRVEWTAHSTDPHPSLVGPTDAGGAVFWASAPCPASGGRPFVCPLFSMWRPRCASRCVAAQDPGWPCCSPSYCFAESGRPSLGRSPGVSVCSQRRPPVDQVWPRSQPTIYHHVDIETTTVCTQQDRRRCTPELYSGRQKGGKKLRSPRKYGLGSQFSCPRWSSGEKGEYSLPPLLAGTVQIGKRRPRRCTASGQPLSSLRRPGPVSPSEWQEQWPARPPDK